MIVLVMMMYDVDDSVGYDDDDDDVVDEYDDDSAMVVGYDDV